ncbi:MAG TPA: hypothetical protein VGK54_00905 [Chloroflexota bacterium]|jgi:hypothetical protein
MASRYVLVVSDERAEAFTKIFGRNRVPIEGPTAEYAKLPRLGRKRVFKIELSTLSDGQRQRLAEYLSTLWDMPSERVEEEIAARGVPIRAENALMIDLAPEPDFV